MPASDRQLYVVPVSARAVRGRADRAVVDGVDADRLLAAADDGSCDALTRLARQRRAKRFHVWAVRASSRIRGTWSRVQRGDWFVFYSRGRIFAVARVFDTCESQSLATALWGAADAADFRYLVLFDQVASLDVPAWEYRSVLGGRFIGFRRLSDDLRATLSRKYGSVEEFIQHELPKADAHARNE